MVVSHILVYTLKHSSKHNGLFPCIDDVFFRLGIGRIFQTGVHHSTKELRLSTRGPRHTTTQPLGKLFFPTGPPRTRHT
nr:unnamed protein product [Callosobruchus chinensis]